MGSFIGRAALLSLALVAATLPARAQRIADPVVYTDRFFRLLADQGTGDAFNYLKDSRLGLVRPIAIEQLREAANNAQKGYGALRRSTLVDQSRIGDVLLQLTYVASHVCALVLYRFEFYNNGNDWLLLGIEINDNALKFPWDSLGRAQAVAGK